MDELLYDSYLRYFTHLFNYGYKSEEDVVKLLFYTFITELVNDRCLTIPEEDYRSLENVLYCLYGTSCLIPYPDYCNQRKKGACGNHGIATFDYCSTSSMNNLYIWGNIVAEKAEGIEIDDIDYS